MRIVPGASNGPVGVSAPTEATSTDATNASTSAVAQSSTAPLQSAVLQSAVAALNQMPDIDHARVSALRDALAKGELPFDAGKLANLIESWHRSGK
jgi:negative regulator of flagellin synthesis FlgM